MPTAATTTQSRLRNIARCVSAAVDTLELVSNTVKTPFLGAISSTSRSLLTSVETVKQNKEACIRLLEQTHQLLYAIIALHIKSDTGGELSPTFLSHIGSFTETLHKVHNFVEAQQEKSWLKQFFRQTEMTALLKDCSTGLQQSLDFFQIQAMGLITDAAELQEYAQNAHQEVLEMIDSLADMNASDGAASINQGFLSTESSSTSISMLPSEPKIFHGRDSELADILSAFGREPTRVAILGAGGMGKTSLSRAVLHHSEIIARYGPRRVFVACDTAPTKIELAALVGAHVGLKTGRDLTRALIRHFSTGPPTLLILDNLETAWDPRESRGNIEEFLSLLTDIQHLALIITMRGAERPAKVHWTRPFLPPLLPLSQAAARQTFVDIADDVHDKQDVDKVLSLTDNLPLAINLIAHLVESEGCLAVLSRWEEERTSIISEGYDRKSNLDISISISLSSPRITSVPGSRDLLSLLSLLPDGLADVELRQANIPINDILRCKTALLRTSLAHQDQGRLKSLVPIREYFQKFYPPSMQLLRPLRLYFHELLDLYIKHRGTLPNRGVADRIALNFTNVQNILLSGLTQENPDLVDTIYSVTHLDVFSTGAGRGHLTFMERISDVLPQPTDHRLEVFVVMRRLLSWRYHPVADSQALVNEALDHFKHFEDPDLQARVHIAMGSYYQFHDDDRINARKYFGEALRLSSASGDIKRQSDTCDCLANLEWQNGDYAAGQKQAFESQRLAKVLGDLYREARGLRSEAMCWNSLGNYKEGISACARARELLALCGLADGEMESAIMSSQGEVHRAKTEYAEARKISDQLIQKVSSDKDPFDHAIALFNLTEVDIRLGATREQVEGNIARIKSIFAGMGYLRGETLCNLISGDFEIREGDLSTAGALLRSCVEASRGKDGEIMTLALGLLANPKRWGFLPAADNWSIIFLVHVLKSGEQLEIHRAFQFLGESFWHHHRDTATATSLFAVALEKFTQMDIHQNRAECMLRLGDIARDGGDSVRAIELWTTARPLFERCAQTKEVVKIGNRLTMIEREMQERHEKSLANLRAIKAPMDSLAPGEGNQNPSKQVPVLS
ncbi:hypothetical protein B0H16DRAFT_1889694 [Mycena metata]|uniref:AAA+ ATPase domain-containing protein n=1 Tax=Mycena metata TaxID=1033252 RepID=A0AAD7IKU8_9AGAR|nr:hypothetical protein B0H16DRAFT_1889694 [Mycena metata]